MNESRITMMVAKPAVPEVFKGRDLPADLARKAGVRPDENVRLLILEPRDKALEKIDETMDSASAEAQSNGLTEEKLNGLLDAR